MGIQISTSAKRGVLLGLVIVVCIILGAGFAAIKWFSRDLPSMARLEMIEPALKTRILAADSTLIKEFYLQDRILLSFDEIPERVKSAFLAVEDRRFYRHFGIDLIRLTSALLSNILHWNRGEGASTITQQLSRDLFLTKEKTFPRKIKEALLALRIERTYSKDEILEMYLNQIYFGSGSYGIEAAARRFFGKTTNELQLNEVALLAGLNKNPDSYNPFRHPERALKRRNVVLGAMRAFDVITEAQLDTLKTKPLGVVRQESSNGDFAAYFSEYVRQTIAEKYGSQAVYREGLTVYTTLDPHLQRIAEDSMETFLAELETNRNIVGKITRRAYLDSLAADVKLEPEYLQSAVIALDPRNGHIKVMVGGRSFHESEWNNAIQARRQPGSAFKVFIYVAAIKQGFRPSDIILDTPLVVEMPNREVYKPRNFSRKFHGAVSLRYAFNESINIPAIKLLQKIGGPSVVDVAKRMGIKSHLMPYLSLALGSFEVNLLELTSAYGVLATGGIRAEPMAILKIEDRNGNVLDEYREYREVVLPPDISYIAVDMLRSVIDEGTGEAARTQGLRIPCAGKTGTTDDYGDGWFIGFTPELAVGVWTGFSHRVSMGRNQTGARVALPIWIDIMKAAYPYDNAPDFERPENIVESIVCTESGLLATPYCPNPRREIFIEGSEPTRQCDIHRISPYDLLKSDRDFRELDRKASGGGEHR